MSQFFEKHKVGIGIFLAVMIVAGAGTLVWQNRRVESVPQKEAKTDELEAKVAELNKQIEDLNSKLKGTTTTETKVVSRTESSTSTNNESQTSNTGQVAGATTEVSEPQGKININTASASQLDTLPGIGPVYAQRIIDYRTANGGFKSIGEIENVKGIGSKTFEKMKDLITI